jgi:ribose transport system substrate-binding protein
LTLLSIQHEGRKARWLEPGNHENGRFLPAARMVEYLTNTKENAMERTAQKFMVVVTAIVAFLLSSAPAWSEDVRLSAGLIPKAGSTKTAPNQFKKNPPWRIAISMPGVGNSWIVQMLEETKYEASKHKEIKELLVTDAEWKPEKQVADLEDLLTKNVDAVMVAPVTPTNCSAVIDKFAAKGIPVIIAGISAGTVAYTSNLITGGEAFGKTGGDFLVKELKGNGTVWMLRGPAGFAEDEGRYQGAVSAFKGTNIKIGAEVYADWSYAKGKQMCENLVLSGKPVDGIWFSGAEMTKGCIEVFQEFKKPLVPMTGEGNNGFLRVWKESGVKSIAPVFPSAMGQAQVQAVVGLLEGKQLYKDYHSVLPPITEANRDKYYRPDLNDNYWVPSALSERKLKELYGKK